MISESNLLSHELDARPVSGENLAAYVIGKLHDPGKPEMSVFESLSSNAGSSEQSWEYVKNRLAVYNYLYSNGLNTSEEDSIAIQLIDKHGVTRDNYLEFFDNPLMASQLISAYEATRSLEHVATLQDEDYRAA